MHETSRGEAELAMKCYSAFMFALKAVDTGLDRKFSSDELTNIWGVVQEVAAGRQTLNVSPAELQASDSQTLPAMRQHLQETMQRGMRAEQEMAAMLLRARDGFAVRDDTAG
jgi:hypothetical protein